MAKIREKGLIAKKVGMTRMVDAEGNVIPVTLLQIPDQKVTKLLTVEKDGYLGYQIGYVAKAEKNLNKPEIGRLRKIGVTENYSKFREFRALDGTAPELGQTLTAEMLKDVGFVDVTGITKGRGFQGAIKRWHKKIGNMSHGSMYHRRTGSIGQRATPGKVYKNKKMPGHLGVDARTVRNLKVVDIDLENNIIALHGSVPGHREGLLEVRSTETKAKASK
ncbi:MAG: 50S ribosomal protein L3 [Deltaproteobacteria bacterium]|nr:50S ribosomal protein L3 [Deltaproteobacteria bacterium]